MAANIVVNGTITCTPDDVAMVTTAVAEHVRLTRAEPGCIAFSIDQSLDDPCVFIVSERFTDATVFKIHGERTRASEWWDKSNHIPRDLKIVEE